MLSAGCIIRGRVENSILSPGVVVDTGASVVDSVVMHDCHIGRDSHVTGGILDKKVKVGKGCVLGNGPSDVPNREKPGHLDSGLVVAGKSTIIPDGTTVGKNSILHPRLRPGDYDGNAIPAGSTIRPKTPENGNGQ